MKLFLTSKPGYEKILIREIRLFGLELIKQGQQWITAQTEEKATKNPGSFDLCFSQASLIDPTEIKAQSVNSLAGNLVDLFIKTIQNKTINSGWPFLFTSIADKGLIARSKTLEQAWLKALKKRMSRIAKLARPHKPDSRKVSPGFFVCLVDFNTAFAAADALNIGDNRMQMDEDAPSRSYLKIEEAFLLLGHQPQKNQKVIDLGAAPGGWSYSALKRGATVIAVDNGELKEPIKSNIRISHLKQDALKFQPDKQKKIDWLFCDIVEDPNLTLKVIERWVKNAWCDKFVVNLKIGRHDPIALLKRINNAQQGLRKYCSTLKVRQLYHDREEITLIGKLYD
ncbi:MAG: SAM-dependent methyltransferase [Candidatus Omnitrophica bacterium]|nr:SAM-dependent methyltransferase [Candidatus Omnitrophota bacterium]